MFPVQHVPQAPCRSCALLRSAQSGVNLSEGGLCDRFRFVRNLQRRRRPEVGDVFRGEGREPIGPGWRLRWLMLASWAGAAATAVAVAAVVLVAHRPPLCGGLGGSYPIPSHPMRSDSDRFRIARAIAERFARAIAGGWWGCGVGVNAPGAV